MFSAIEVGVFFYLLATYLIGFSLFLTSPHLSEARLRANRRYRWLSPVSVPYAFGMMIKTWLTQSEEEHGE